MKYILLMVSLILFSCKANVMLGLSSQSTDEALYEQAEAANNQQDFDAAINIINNRMSSTARAWADTKELLASAYAGKCGFNFLTYTNSISSGTVSGSAFSIMKGPFVGQAVTPSHCLTALQVMDTVGTPAQRTANQNTFVAILGMVYTGASLRVNTDMFPTNGDGTIDVGVCAGITDAQVDMVIIGFGYFTNNLSYVSSSVLGSGSLTSLTQVTNVCSTLVGSSCSVTSSAAITAPMRTLFRKILNTQEYGIGSFATGGNDLLIVGACP